MIGYNFNRIYRFDSVLRLPLEWKIDRKNTRAIITIPSFACSMGLSMPNKYGLFRFSATFAAVTDMMLDERKNNYEPVHDTIGLHGTMVSTDWFTRTTTVAAQELNLQMDINQPDIIFNNNDTILLAIAIEYGELDAFGNPTAVKGGGAGKILGVG